MEIQQLPTLRAILDQPQHIGVIPHQNPDGDALGVAWLGPPS